MTKSARTIQFPSASRRAFAGALSAFILTGAGVPNIAAAASSFEVQERGVDDLKAVFGTVRSTDEIYARVRTGGTIASLTVTKGAEVKMGDVLATVTDQKLALRMRGLEAQIAGLKARAETARIELQRQEQLAEKGYAAGAKLDEARASSEGAANQLKSAEAERQVITQQVQEGEVLAPANGRVLTVPVTAGSVVMPGETIAKIAANAYVLRLELPERHARFIKVGDPVVLGGREMSGSDVPPARALLHSSIPSCRTAASSPTHRPRGLANTSWVSGCWSGFRPASGRPSPCRAPISSSVSVSTTPGSRRRTARPSIPWFS